MKQALRMTGWLIAMIASVMATQNAFAQDDLVGVWEGMLEVAPGQGVEVHFNFVRAADGTLTATVSAPDQPALQDLPVDDLTFDQGSLSLAVNALSGTYAGRLADGIVQGTWTQPGSSIALNLRPYEELTLTAADMERLLGSWIGKLRPIPDGDLEVTVVFRFERDAQGAFNAFMDSPDEGAMGIPVDGVGMEGNQLTLEVNRARMEFTGMLDGESIDGDWVQASRSLELSLKRGEYEVAGLQLSDEDFARVEGPWHGQVGPLTMVFRFERGASGQAVAFLDSPDQGANNIPVTSVAVEGDQLTVGIAVVGGTFTGTIADTDITGQWLQMGQPAALTLAKGPYVPNAGLSAQSQQYLQGTWRGTVSGTDLVFRFLPDANGDFETVIDIASVGMLNVPVSGMTLEGQSLHFVVNAINARFAGALSGGGITGTWTRLDADSPLTLTRD